MTDSGDHGGSTTEELLSPLFVYSTAPLFQTKTDLDESSRSCDDVHEYYRIESNTVSDDNNLGHKCDNHSLKQKRLMYDPLAQQWKQRELRDALFYPRIVSQVRVDVG